MKEIVINALVAMILFLFGIGIGSTWQQDRFENGDCKLTDGKTWCVE